MGALLVCFGGSVGSGCEGILMAKPKRKQLSGGAKMRLAGRKAILLGVTVEQLEKIRRAAQIELRPVAQFVCFHAVQAAEKLLSADSDKTTKDGSGSN
jgi:hypothetical protein